MGRAAKSLIPTPVSLGYALFLAVNASVIWGGVFPFLPYGFQTDEVVVGFFVAQATAFAIRLLIEAIGGASAGAPRVIRNLRASPAPGYITGWCLLIAATYVSNHAIPILILSGLLVGFSTAGFFVWWNSSLSSTWSTTGSRDQMLGTVYAPVLYLILNFIPIALTVYLIAFVFMPIFTLAIRINERKGRSFDEGAQIDDPAKSLRSFMGGFWRVAVCIGTVGFASGSIRALAITAPEVGAIVNNASMAGALIASTALYLVWQYRPLRINLASVFRILFPFLVTAFALVPLLGYGYLLVLTGAVYAVFGCSVLLMMMQCQVTARARKLPAAVVYGFVGFIVYAMHDMGFIAGRLVSSAVPQGFSASSATAFATVYMMAIAMYFAQGGLKGAFAPGHVSFDRVELLFTAAAPSMRRREGDACLTERNLDARGKGLADHYQLSVKEREVMAMMLNGFTAKRMSEELMVSVNTVNTHVKRMYSKLGVHKRQELIDLVESFQSFE